MYANDHNLVQAFTKVDSLSEETWVQHYLDGADRERLTISEHPGSTGGLRASYNVFDIVGRVVEASRPTEINGYWQPTGDDVAGYIHSQQAYDWKGRPTVTTNPDNTTKQVSYMGCGCAGGDVVTIQDEGQVNSGTLQHRQQQVFNDVLGRTAKTQAFNWDGSLYSTTTTKYNVRDQVTSLLEYQGAETTDGSCPIGTCQQAWASYDGYGRISQQKRPVESNPTTWIYNGDDTLSSITDARGVIATASYNNRHLVTGISYSAPAGVTAAASVGFDYDEAGNRRWMTDGMGRMDYVYDTLSRLKTETRQFNGLGSFALNYDYNVAGELNSITDPFGHQVSYTFDKTGRVTGVTGSPFGNVTQYASNL